MHVSSSLSNEFVNTIANILMFSAVPLVWYLLKERTVKGFIHSLGIYKPKRINLLRVFFIVTAVYLITLAANIVIILSAKSGRDAVDIQGYKLIELFLYLLLYGMKTGIAEEILFRGFIAKKLIKKFGFSKGNVIQAVVFGSLHFVIKGSASTADIIVRIINASLLGYVFGYIMVRECDESIVPGMILHMLINMVSSAVLSLIL